MPNHAPPSRPQPQPTDARTLGVGGPRVAPVWRSVAVAAVLASAFAGNAWGLALGRVSVQSLLGEPLRAEIDVRAISEAEAASLQIGIAPAERFRAANLEFNPLLQDVSLELQRRADGRTVIVVRSSLPVPEPFLDLLVHARWAGGELLRGYTLLFDPPNLQPPIPVAPAAAPPPVPPPAPAAPPVTDVRPAQPVPAAPAPPPQTAAPPGPARGSATRITVRPGDTAGRIAAAYKPADLTLEQMLVALLRANPQAFIRNNVNLVRAGAVIDLPDVAQAGEVDPQEARRIVAAQTRDFNEYRRRLAAAAPVQNAPPAARTAAGGVQAAVAEDKPQASAQDKLTLTKPGAAAPAEAMIAEELRRRETEQRVAELNRNLQELEQLQQTASTAAVDAPAPAPPADAGEGPGPEVATAPPEAPPPPPVAAPAPAAPPAAAPAEPGLVRTLLTHPLTVPAAGGVALLLAVLAWWRVRQRRRETAGEPRAAEPPMDAAGQTVDSGDNAPALSMADSPSRLDAGGEVDPVAEADAYLAYGRDQQAEEILLEALRLHPDRLPVRLKLLEIYAQRPDAVRFEAAARELQSLTQGQGPEWERACQLGLTLDPDNPLYRPGGSGAPELDIPVDAPATEPSGEPRAGASAADDMLDFDLDLPPADAQPRSVSEDGAALKADNTAGIDFDLDLPGPPGAEPPAAAAPVLPPALDGLSLDLPADDEAPRPADVAPAAPSVDAPAGDFASTETTEELDDNNPLETKLSLAREFEAIGDVDGARTLAEEVVAEASGELRERARAFLAQLS